jgi:tRNA (mo5U34)-methyltransferase
MPQTADQARVDQIRWYHELDFGRGVRTRTSHENPEGVRQVWRFIEEHLARLPLRGATVLDIGAWDGYWSFFAERHGAAHVLATDDATQRWADQGGIRLAKELLGSRVEIREDVPVYELAGLGRTFDVVLCLGVHYHLWDPLFALTQIRHCCHPGTLVVVEGELAWAGMQPFEARYFASAWQECVLSAPLLERFLRLAYLRVDEQVWMHPVVAGEAAAAPRIDRSLLVCRPFAGTNPLYTYRPHFGLHRYDERFGSDGPVQRRARLQGIDAPAPVTAGDTFTVRVEVTNTGSHPWRALCPEPPEARLDGPGRVARHGLDYDAAFLAGPIRPGGSANESVAVYRRFIETEHQEGTVTLGAQLWSADGQTQIAQDYGRGFLGHDLAPGATTAVTLRLLAPTTPGRYVLRVDPVCEYVAWFAHAGSAPLDVPLTVV